MRDVSDRVPCSCLPRVPRLACCGVLGWVLVALLATSQAFVAEAEDFSPPLSPDEALKTFTLRDGLAIELVAAEPLVMDPVAFDFGPDGRLWVAEMGDYPLGVDGKGQHGGKIKVLTDTDGDGRYDQAAVFLEGLGYPNGVIPHRKGALISVAPDILYAEDTDGDGKADVKKVLYTGFPAGNQQHRMNGFWWGLDNWLYVADAAGKIKSTQTGQELDVGKRDLRIRPDEGLMEPATGQSQYGRCRDDWDNWFGCGNSEPAYHFVLADEYLRANPYFAPPDLKVQISVAPGAAPVFPTSKTVARFNDHNKANRFTSACGLSIYRDTLVGADFLGNTFVSEPVHNLVHRELVARQGTTFTSRPVPGESNREFLASTDGWFRPTMTRTGPDGALYIADMYRLVIEHPEWIPKEWQARLDLRAGHDKGRIYRIAPRGKALRSVPRFDKLSVAELVEALKSPNGPQRDLAQRQLIERGAKEAAPALEALLTSGATPEARVHALCTLDGLGALSPETLEKTLFTDGSAGVRRHATRLSEPWLAEKPFLGVLIAAYGDFPTLSDELQLQRLQTLGTWRHPKAGEALAKFLDGPVVRRVPGPPTRIERRDRYLEAAALAASLPHLDAVLTRLSGASITRLVEPLMSMALGSRNQPAVARLLTAAAEGGPETLANLLDTLERRGASLAKLGAEGGPEAKAALDQLGKTFDDARAVDAKSPLNEQLAAVRLLGRGPTNVAEDIEKLAGFLAPQQPAELQLAAAAALGKLRDPQIPAKLLAGWKAHGPKLRAEILGVLTSRRESLGALLDAVEAKQVLPSDFDAAGRARLIEHKDGDIRNRALKLLAGASNPDRQKVVEQHASVLQLAGDATRGAEIFLKKCGVCHQLQGKGHAIGPDLAALTDKSPQAMLTAILDPNRAVESRYVSYIVTTADGLAFTGLLTAESGGSITLLAAEGKLQNILRADVEELQASGKSLMPEGLEKDLPAQDLADVIAYVRTSGPTRKQFPGNTPELVRPEALRGELYLLARQGEIFGPTLVFEPKYGNVGYWQSERDTVVWTIEITEPGEYVVSLDYACPDQFAGQELYFEVGGERLAGRVKSTGSWDAYGRAELGRVKLAKGQHRAGVRPAGKLTGALLDLKSIGLRPVK